jgi:hypothetical protein
MNHIYVKLLSGDILKLELHVDEICVMSLSKELKHQYSSLFTDIPRYCFHFYREKKEGESDDKDDKNDKEIDFLDTVKNGELVYLLVLPFSHIVIFLYDDRLWFRDVNKTRQGSFRDLMFFCSNEELEELSDPYSIQKPQLVIDVDRLSYFFEPSDSDPPEYVFTKQFILDNLNLNFNAPSIDDYAEVFGWESLDFVF